MEQTIKLFNYLADQGFEGQVNERLYAFLVAAGYSGAIDDMFKAYLKDEGYTGSYNSMMKEWFAAVVEGGAVSPISITTVGQLNPTNVTIGDTVTIVAPTTDDVGDTIVLTTFTQNGIDVSGSISAGEFVTTATGSLSATWSITRDGTTITTTTTLDIKTAVTQIDVGGVRMQDPNDPGAGVTVVTFDLFFSVSSLAILPANNHLVFQEGRGFEMDLISSGGGTIDFGKMEDGTGVNLVNLLNDYGDRVFRFPEGDGEVTTDVPRDKMMRFTGRIDYVNGTLVVDMGNINVFNGTFTATTPYTQPNGYWAAFTNGLTAAEGDGFNFERFAIYYNDSPTPSVLVEGDAATVNANPAVTHGSVSDTTGGVPQSEGVVVFATPGPGTTINGSDLDFVTGSSTGLFARGRVASTAGVPFRVYGTLDVSLLDDDTVVYVRLGPAGILSSEAGAGDLDQITDEYSFVKTTGMTTKDIDVRAVGIGDDFFGVTCLHGSNTTITVDSLNYEDVPNTVEYGEPTVTVLAGNPVAYQGFTREFTKDVQVWADPEGFPVVRDPNPGVGGDLGLTVAGLWPAHEVSSDGDTHSGMMVDPGATTQTLSVSQGWADNPSRFGATAIAYYVDANNYHPGKLARTVYFNGVDLPTDCRIQNARGRNYPSSHDHLLMRLGKMSITTSARTDGLYMPALSTVGSTSPGINVSDIDLDVLPSKAAPTGWTYPTLDSAIRGLQYGPPGYCDNIAGEGAQAPLLTGDGYSRGLMDQINPGMQILMSDADNDTKLILARYAVGHFLDAIAQEDSITAQGRQFRIAGGSAIKQCWAVIGAALVQGAAGVDDISARLLDTAAFHGNITAAFVSNPRSASTASRPLTRFYDYHVGMPYWSQTASANQPDAWASNDGFGEAGSHARSSYNQIAINNTAMGMLLIRLTTGADALLNRQPMLDYYDRAMPEWVIRSNGVAMSEEPDNFTQALWAEHRPDGGMVKTHSYGLDLAGIPVTADYDDPLHEPSTLKAGMPKIRTLIAAMGSLDIAEVEFGKGVYPTSTLPTGYSLTGAPAGVSIDSAGLMSWTGVTATAGSFDEFTVTATKAGQSDLTSTLRFIWA